MDDPQYQGFDSDSRVFDAVELEDSLVPRPFSHFSAKRADGKDRTAACGTTLAQHTPETGGHELAALLRVLRNEAKLTLAQVALAIGVSAPTVWAWEHGRARPTPDKLAAIAKAFGVELEMLTRAADGQERGTRSRAAAQDSEATRAQLLEAGRQLIAKAYNIEPSAIRISVEL